MGSKVDQMYEEAMKNMSPEDIDLYESTYQEVMQAHAPSIREFVQLTKDLFNLGEMDLEACVISAFMYGVFKEQEKQLDDRLKNIGI